MSDYIDDINTIGDLLEGVGVARFFKQNLPTTYVANTIGIRWQGDSDALLTQNIYTEERLYQIVYFGSSEVDCLNKSKAIARILRDTHKTQTRTAKTFITLGRFAMSAPFKTETDGVYAIVGVLPITVQMAHTTQGYHKMAVIKSAINEGGN